MSRERDRSAALTLRAPLRIDEEMEEGTTMMEVGSMGVCLVRHMGIRL